MLGLTSDALLGLTEDTGNELPGDELPRDELPELVKDGQIPHAEEWLTTGRVRLDVLLEFVDDDQIPHACTEEG